MATEIELVGKIGSMALIDKQNGDIDYNRFAHISRQLKPGMIWVSSGATEIGRLDFIRRAGSELSGDMDEIKTDYASQGQAILMNTYRSFIDAKYGVRQVLVEHYHFNDEKKRNHIKVLLERAAESGCIPIINYNDAVSAEENRKMEIRALKEERGYAVELVDNDETAAQIACLVKAKTLVILTELDGIYSDLGDRSSLIREITAHDGEALSLEIENVKKLCEGASRRGANGAKAKLEYIKPCVLSGTRVFIASAKYDLKDIVSGNVPSTAVYIK